MKDYTVHVNVEFYKTYSVEAESEEEAEQIAIENFNCDISSDWDSLETKVEEI